MIIPFSTAFNSKQYLYALFGGVTMFPIIGEIIILIIGLISAVRIK